MNTGKASDIFNPEEAVSNFTFAFLLLHMPTVV